MNRAVRPSIASRIGRLLEPIVAIVLLFVVTSALLASGRTRYVYDELGRIVRAGNPDGTVVSYSYDPAGNVLSRTIIRDADFDEIPDETDPCTDTDEDGWGDPGFPANTCGLDNCPLLANPDQADADADGAGDDCDTCTDTDRDAHGDPGFPANVCPLDNCATVSNPAQLDGDADLAGDACDCAPDDGANASLLGPVRGLRFSTKSDLSWIPPADDGGGVLGYDVLRSTSPSDFSFADCLAADTAATAASDPESPGSSGAFHYLVRVEAACGGEHLGLRTPETRRTGAACVGQKTVFLTSTAYNGNLGGLAGADVKCQERAAAAGRQGIYRAWLGDATASPASRLTHSTAPYVRIDGVRVADNWGDLTDGSLQNPINVTEQGLVAPTGLVWTGALPDGSVVGAYPGYWDDCWNWTQWSDYEWGAVGVSGSTNAEWSFVDWLTCDSPLSLYCFEQ